MATKEPDKPSGLVQLNTRMPQVVIDKLDARVAELNKVEGWEKWSRSDLVRDAVVAFLGVIEAEKKGRQK